MKRTGSNNNDQNVDLNTADNDIQLSQLAAANYGDSGTAPNDSGKISVLSRRTLGGGSLGSGATVRVLVGGHFIFYFRRQFRFLGSQCCRQNCFRKNHIYIFQVPASRVFHRWQLKSFSAGSC